MALYSSRTGITPQPLSVSLLTTICWPNTLISKFQISPVSPILATMWENFFRKSKQQTILHRNLFKISIFKPYILRWFKILFMKFERTHLAMKTSREKKKDGRAQMSDLVLPHCKWATMWRFSVAALWRISFAQSFYLDETVHLVTPLNTVLFSGLLQKTTRFFHYGTTQ